MESLDTKELIRKFYGFFDEYMRKEIKKAYHSGSTHLGVSFFDISEYDFELGDMLLAYPKDVISIMEGTLEQFKEDEHSPRLKVRLTSIPSTEQLMIREIRSEHLGKLVILEGLVRRKTDVRPRLTHIEYLCTNPSCNYSQERIKVPQVEDKAKTLKACPKCKSAVETVNRVLLDSQNLVLEELTEQLENSSDQPKRMNILLQGDLVAPFKDSKSNPGSRVYVIGIVTEVQVPTKTGAESIHYDLVIEGNYIDLAEEDYSEFEVSKEDEKQIKEIGSSDHVFETLIESTAPSIYGYHKIKEAILLQQFGGTGGTKGDGVKTRGDIHILLIGDPGAAKSQMLKAATKIAPKSSFVSGKSATGAGLCVSPKSTLLTNPGGMETIENVVETGFDSKEEPYNDWIWKRDDVEDFKIQSMNHDLKLHSQYPKTLWKLKAPEYVYQIELSSGKKVELTGNTQLYALRKGNPEWVRSMELFEGDYIATPRRLIGGEEKFFTLDLIQSNPHVHHIEGFMSDLIEKLEKKYGSKSVVANKFNIDVQNLYSRWVREDLKGVPRLDDVKALAEDLGEEWRDKISKVSLYNGKCHILPQYIDEEVLYLAGLIAGDGDFRKTSTNTYSIRFSNKDSLLNYEYRRILEDKFDLGYDVETNKEQIEATRTHSKLLGEILLNLGIPLSPKSSKLEFSQDLLHMRNDLLAFYIGALYDTDGSINRRKSKGSNTIEFYTCSEQFARQLQQVLLRYEIYSKIRSKNPTEDKISGNYIRYVVVISGNDNIEKFSKNIPLKHNQKQEKLSELVFDTTISNSNVDVVPGVGGEIKKLLVENNISLKEVNWHENLSRKGLNILLSKLKEKNVDVSKFEPLAQSDIIWEKVVSITQRKPEYEYVYDLTVEDSHNFVVDGVLVHNTATVMKDELTKGWALEAGAMVLASGGLCAIDELDKMSEEDTSAMHEALEQQSISIAKANIRATLRSETTVLGAANPKLGRFDPYGDIAKQINFPPALISRFDLIFILRDIPDQKRDDLIADHILQTHKDKSKTATELSNDFMKKYIAYARKLKPVLTKEAIEKIKKFYVSIRNASDEEEGGEKSIPITARQLEAIVRLAEGYAKAEISKQVTQDHAQRAIDLMLYCLEKIGVDPKTGEMDIDRITTGVTTKSRSSYWRVLDIIKQLAQENPNVEHNSVLEKAEEIKIDKVEVEKTLEKLKQDSLIMEPRRNIYMLLD